MKTIVLANLPWWVNGRQGVRAGSRWPHLKCRAEGAYIPFPFYLAYAAALLQRAGFSVRLIDAIAEGLSYRAFLEKVLSCNPWFMVVETSTVSLRHDLAALRSYRERLPVVLCGPDVNIAEPEFLHTHNNITAVMYGEYEQTLLELAQAWKDNRLLREVPGLLCRQAGEVYKTPSRPLIENLDTLPWPLREQLPMHRYLEAPCGIPTPCASMWASRGCPAKCSFCLWPQVMYRGNTYRTRSPVDVVNEMEYLVREKGYRSIYFDDDTWNVGRERLVLFCEELQRRKLQIPWAIMARANLMDKELLHILRRAGLFAVKYGVESARQEILDSVSKRADLHYVEEIIRYTHFLGIRTHLTFMFGLPGETSASIRQTMRYATHLDPTSVQFSIATPFPGTIFYEKMEKAGLICTKDWEKYDGNYHSVIKTAHLSARQLVRARKDAYAFWAYHCFLRGDTEMGRKYRLRHVLKRIAHRLRIVRERVNIFRYPGADGMRFSFLHYAAIPAHKLNSVYLWEPAWELRESSRIEKKQTDVFRVICLGDSTTKGFGELTEQETYPFYLQQLLAQEIKGKRLEVINAGEVGFSSFQGERYLKSKIEDLDPDIVIAWFGTEDNARAWIYRDKEQNVKGEETPLRRRTAVAVVKSFAAAVTNLFVNVARVAPADYERYCANMLKFSREKQFGLFFVVPFCVDIQHQVFHYLCPYKVALEKVALNSLHSVIDVVPGLRGYEVADVFIETSHPKSTGNRLIAEIICEHIRAGYIRGNRLQGQGSTMNFPTVSRVPSQERSQPRKRAGIGQGFYRLMRRGYERIKGCSGQGQVRSVRMCPDVVLQSDALRLMFGRGRSSLIWQGREITKDVGLTTSFYYTGRWYDATQAQWMVRQCDGTQAEFLLRWDDIAVEQLWKVSLCDTKIIWSLYFDAPSGIVLNEYKAGVMLCREYRQWADGAGMGFFPRITGWEEIRLHNAKSSQVRVGQKRFWGGGVLPHISLRVVAKHDDMVCAELQNTSRDINARLMQMKGVRLNGLKSGLHHFLTLEISIEKDGDVRFQEGGIAQTSPMPVKPSPDEAMLPIQSVAGYSRKTPLAYLKEQMRRKGAGAFVSQLINFVTMNRWQEYYQDLMGIQDGRFAYKGPSFVQIDLTNDCNNDCIGCWCNSPLLGDKAITPVLKQQALPRAVVLRTLDELRRMGTREIYFAGGGEPFMHPHILEIVGRVKQLGMRCYINTNFTLVDDEIARRLVSLGVDHLVVSVWAGTAETYARTHPNKSPDTFRHLKSVLSGLNTRAGAAAGPKVNMYNVISNVNCHELGAMVDFAVETGCDSLEFTVIDTIPHATDALLLSEEQRASVIAQCRLIQRRLETDLNGRIQVLQFDQFIRRLSLRDAEDAQYDRAILAEMPCYIGWLFARILADGNVNFCLKAHRIPVGNILAQSFGKIWNSPIQQEYRRTALCASRDHAFFSSIGNDPSVRTGCYKSCDDLNRNVVMHKKVQSLTALERRALGALVFVHKAGRLMRTGHTVAVLRQRWLRAGNPAAAELRQGRLRIIPDRGGVRLLWDNCDVTACGGLNTSLSVLGVWHDSSRSNWKIVKRARRKLVLESQWQYVPVLQHWELSLSEEGTLDWGISMVLDSYLAIGEYKMSVIISNRFTHWRTAAAQGLLDGQPAWLNMLEDNGATVSVSVFAPNEKPRIPELTLSDITGPGEIGFQLQNMERVMNARVMSARLLSDRSGEGWAPGTYDLFRGRLSVRM